MKILENSDFILLHNEPHPAIQKIAKEHPNKVKHLICSSDALVHLARGIAKEGKHAIIYANGIKHIPEEEHITIITKTKPENTKIETIQTTEEMLKEILTYSSISKGTRLINILPAKGKHLFTPKKIDILKKGEDAVIISDVESLKEAMKSAETLEKQKISCGVALCHTISPLDKNTLSALASSTKQIVATEPIAEHLKQAHEISFKTAPNNQFINTIRNNFDDRPIPSLPPPIGPQPSISPNLHFNAIDGTKLSSLFDLHNSLRSMSRETFEHHTKERNDFAKWTKDVFGEKALAEDMKRAKNQKELLQILRNWLY